MPSKLSHCQRHSLRAIACCWIAAIVGCLGDGQPARHPVRGQILFSGRPISADALVIFHPQNSAGTDLDQKSLPKPQGYTDEQGHFRLTTLESNDGAPAGDYRITVELRQERKSGEEVTRDGPNILPTRFAKPETSNLSFRVQAGTNEVPTLHLTK